MCYFNLHQTYEVKYDHTFLQVKKLTVCSGPSDEDYALAWLPCSCLPEPGYVLFIIVQCGSFYTFPH